MSINVVKQQLEEFQREVLAGHCLSEHQSQLIEKIADDLALLCEQGDSQSDVEQLGILSRQLNEQAVHFEQEHPTIAQVMRQIVDTLSRMGV